MKRNGNLRKMIIVALLSAIAAILMYARFPLPFAPGFMDVDISEVPGLIAGFLFGPLWAIVEIALKLIIKLILQNTSTFGVGEFSNLIVASSFVVPASLIYRRNKTFKSAMIGTFLGVIIMSLIAVISNYYLVFPAFGMPMETFAPTMSKINPLVSNVPTFLLFSIIPFNLVKGFLNLVVIAAIFKPLNPIMKNS